MVVFGMHNGTRQENVRSDELFPLTQIFCTPPTDHLFPLDDLDLSDQIDS